MAYDHGYETEPIGGGNPYYRCVHCKISDPQINGDINKHSVNCRYRQQKQHYVLNYIDEGVLDDALYDDEELLQYREAVNAQYAYERRDIKEALTYLQQIAEKIRAFNPKLYEILKKQP